MSGQFELGEKHLECIKKTQNLILEIEETSIKEGKNTKEKIKQYLPEFDELHCDYLGMAVSLEEIAKQDSLTAYVLTDQAVFRELMDAYGQKKADQVLEKGETIGLLCLEPGFSGIQDIQAKALKTQNGWQLSGTKFIGNEQLYSDKYLVFARDEKGKIRLFTVSEEKIKVNEISKTISNSKIILNQAKISTELNEECCVGLVNDNFERALTVARTLVAAVAAGIAQSALLAGIKTAKETKNLRGESLSASQSLQFTLADMFSEIEAARMLIYYSADSIDKNMPNIKTASMAKVKASEAAAASTAETLHILGNIGFVSNTDLTLVQRAAHSRIKGGTNRLQKAQIYRYMLAKK